jgi:hypothetical protein
MPLIIKHSHRERLLSLQLATTKSSDQDSETVKTCLIRYWEFYEDFKRCLADNNFVEMAFVMDAYREYAKNLERKHAILGERTKYYSSIMEEAPTIISSDLVSSLVDKLGLDKHNLFIGGKPCTIRIAANPDGSYFHEEKNIDFCLAIDASGVSNWVPLVGLEVKKYCDKTMFGTILETYKSLQIFRPRTYYGFLVEDEARGKEVTLNSPLYRQEFILCGVRNKSELNPVSPLQLEYFVKELSRAVEDALAFLAQES